MEQEKYFENELKSNIFFGCFFFINSYDQTTNDVTMDELKRLIRENGGRCSDVGRLSIGTLPITHFVCDTFTTKQLSDENKVFIYTNIFLYHFTDFFSFFPLYISVENCGGIIM